MPAQHALNYNSFALTVIAALILSLQGCGGGGGDNSGNTGQISGGGGGSGGGGTTSGSAGLQVTQVAQEVTPPPTQAQTPVQTPAVDFDAGSVVPGWSYVAGTPPYATESTNTWLLSNPGNVSSNLVTASGSASTPYVYTLQYNFGCGTTSITLRTQDCRNVVSMYTGVRGGQSVNANSAVSFYVRNADASAQFAVRVRDSSGQTLQYPFQTRFIESQDPSQWVRITVPLKYPEQYDGGNRSGIPQGTLTNIEIVASALNSSTATVGLNYPVGRVEIKNVELQSSTATTYALAPNNAVKVNGYDTYAPLLAVTHNTFDVPTLNKAKSIGIKVIRKDIFWHAVERYGAFNFSEYTAGLDTLNKLGMKALWILDYTHPDHGGVLPPQNPRDIDAYAAYAKETAALTTALPADRRNVVGYEVWNEPDQKGFWPNPDPSKYAALLNAARKSIRDVDKTTPVISAGIAVDEPNFMFQLAQTGALNNVTAIGVHPYRPDIITATSPSYRRKVNTPESYASEIIVHQNALRSLGVNTPMWNTEWGYSTVAFLDPAAYGAGDSVKAANRQGVLTLRMVLTQLAIKAPLITIYNLVDKGTDPADKEHHFGLLKHDLTEKPAYTGLKTLYQHSNGRTFKGFLTDVPNGMHVLRWDGSTDRTFCAWLDDQGRPATLNLPANVNRVTNWDGTAQPITTNSDGSKSVALTEETGPVFVLFR